MSRDAAVRGLHLAVLWAFAFAQPLLDLLGDNSEFFVARGNEAADILVFSIVLVLVPPAVLLGAELLVGLLSRRAERGLHLALVGILAAAFALQIIKDLVSGPAGLLILVALILGAGAALAYERVVGVRTALTYLSPAPAVFLLLFLFATPVSDLILPQEEVEARATKVSSPAPVVFVVLDEFPSTALMNAEGEIDRSRYPNFARFSEEGTWYRNATSVADSTTKAVPSLLTGQSPKDVSPTVRVQPDNLFTLLEGHYRLQVMEAATQLCPQHLCGRRVETPPRLRKRLQDLASDLSVVSEHLLLPEGISVHLPAVDQAFSGFRNAGDEGERLAEKMTLNQTPRFNRFLSLIGPEQRALYFLHLLLPHRPWVDLPTGEHYGLPGPDVSSSDGPSAKAALAASDWLAAHATARNMLEAGYADRLVGRLVSELKAEGVWERALVIVTADQGISFRPGTSFRVAKPETIGEVGSVPLFVKLPGQEDGGTSDESVRGTAIVPTIADVIGAPLPYETDDRSLRDGAGHDEVETLHGEEFVSLPVEEWERRRDEVLARNERLFGSGGGFGPIYRYGPGSELIGRPAPSADTGQPPARADLDGGSGFGVVEPGSDLLPALLTGSLSGEIEPGDPLAAAANGRIAAVGEAFELAGETRFSLIVPPDALRAGQNSLRVYRVLDGKRLEALD